MTVSIIVASYNYGRFLSDALESIQRQTFGDWEAIIIDDGSTDESLSIARTFLTDRRFRLIEQRHRGQSATKNAGIAASQGQFIAFLDADDRWHDSKLERQLVTMNRLEVGVVYSRRRIIDPTGVATGTDDRVLHRGQVTSAMFRDNFVCFSSSLVRRKVLNRIGTFDERIRLAIDYDLWLRASRVCEFDFVDEPLVDYRVGHANLSRRVAERLDTALSIMDRFRREIDRPPMLDPAVARMALIETYRHRGIVGRAEPGAGRTWLKKALWLRPFDKLSWRAMAASYVPTWLRRWRRGVVGIPDWEASLVTANRKAA